MANRDSGLSKEFFVGLFVAAGIALLAFFVFSAQSLTHYFQDTGIYKVKFDYLGGLKAGQPVLYAGSQVGVVRSISLGELKSVWVVTIDIPKKIPVYSNSTVSISSSGVVGDKVVEIIPPNDEPGKRVESGAILEGEDPLNVVKIFDQVQSVFEENQDINVERLINDVRTTMTNLKVFSTELRGFTGDNRKQLESTLDNLSVISKQLRGVFEKNKNVELGTLVNDIQKTTENLKQFSLKLKTLTDDNRKKIQSIIDNLDEASTKIPGVIERIDRTTDSLDRLTSQLSNISDENRKELRRLIRNLDHTAENMKTFSEMIERKPSALFWGK